MSNFCCMQTYRSQLRAMQESRFDLLRWLESQPEYCCDPSVTYRYRDLRSSAGSKRWSVSCICSSCRLPPRSPPSPSWTSNQLTCPVLSYSRFQSRDRTTWHFTGLTEKGLTVNCARNAAEAFRTLIQLTDFIDTSRTTLVLISGIETLGFLLLFVFVNNSFNKPR